MRLVRSHRGASLQATNKNTRTQLIHIPLYLLAAYLDKRDLCSNVTHMAILPQSRHLIQRLRARWEAFRTWKDMCGRPEWGHSCLQMLRNRYPRLTYESRFCGGTGYLDGIRANDVQCGVMEGQDIHGRAFFTIRYACEDTAFMFDGNMYDLHQDRICCLTIFQRFTDSSQSWCKAGRDTNCSRAPLLYGSQTLLDSKTLHLLVANIFRMMSGLPIVYFDYRDKKENTASVKRYLRCKLV